MFLTFNKEGKFFLPPTLSREAQDLLKCMLSVNPLRRIKLGEIRQHPWVLANIQPKDKLIEAASIDIFEKINAIDEEILKKILSFKFCFNNLDLNGVLEAIKANRNEDFVVAYNLLKNEKYKLFLNDFLSNSNSRTPPFQSDPLIRDFPFEVAA